MMEVATLLLATVVSGVQPHPQMASVQVTVANGTISGAVVDDVAGFLGIPYATPPLSNLRLEMPTPHSAWDGVKDATKAGSICVQGVVAPSPPSSQCNDWCQNHGYPSDECGCGVCGSFGGCSWSCKPDAIQNSSGKFHKCPASPSPAVEAPIVSEDCLFLNVFTPASSIVAAENGITPLKPVMFYIHGGGFVAGSAPAAWNLTRTTGHVVVSIQYRLGVFGFFSTGNNPTNLGLEDQKFALRWVIDNVKSFGGDPNKIMIFGCSAGGASVAGMLTDPTTVGMYTAAGIESPGGHQGWMGDSKRSDDDWMSTGLNLNNSAILAQQLGCKTSSNISCLQGLGMAALYRPSVSLRFAPAKAHEGDYPLGLIRRGQWNKVPTIIGGQSCESCTSALLAFGPYTRSGVTKAQFQSALIKAGFSGTDGSGVGPDELEVWYAERIASEGRWRTFARINSDSGHACSSTLHGEALGSTFDKVWRYFFAYAPNAVGATHGGDETWLFDTKQGNPSELTLSHDMSFWWTSLNANGDPNIGALSASPDWTSYSPNGSHINVMWLGNGTSAVPAMGSTSDTTRPECEHWKTFLGW